LQKLKRYFGNTKEGEVVKEVKVKRLDSFDVIGLYEIAYSQFNWDYWTVMSTPIPVLIDSIEALKKRLKREHDEIKKANKKK
jgi:hypothetical protein